MDILIISIVQKVFPLISLIEVKYNLEKTDIYVSINKLIENFSEYDTIIDYETNITDITNILIDLEAFMLTFSNSNSRTKDCYCHSGNIMDLLY